VFVLLPLSFVVALLRLLFVWLHHLLAVVGSVTGLGAGERLPCFLCFPTSLEVILDMRPLSDFASCALHHAFLYVQAIYVWLNLLFFAADFCSMLNLDLSYGVSKPAAVTCP